MVDKLKFTPETDRYGNTYGLYSPTNTQLTDKINELIDEIHELHSKVSELENKINELECKCNS